MLTTRAAKRDGVGVFNTDLMLDILDDGRPIGLLVYNKKVYKAALTLGDIGYVVEQTSDRPKCWVLKDPAGAVLGLGEQVKQSFVVSRGEQKFDLRKLKRPYHLYRAGSDQSLGLVGQKKFFSTTLYMELPPEFDPAFQVFLLALVLTVTMQQLESLTS